MLPKFSLPLRIIGIGLILFVLHGSSCAQGKFSASAGWGYYELVNIGVHWNISETSSVSVFGGSNFGLKNTKELSAGLSYNKVYTKPVFWNIRAGYSLGTVYWSSDDELYYFRSFAFPVMLLTEYQLSPSISLRLEGGVLLNAVVTSDRKQNVEAGYPERVNGNIRTTFIFKLGAK